MFIEGFKDIVRASDPFRFYTCEFVYQRRAKTHLQEDVYWQGSNIPDSKSVTQYNLLTLPKFITHFAPFCPYMFWLYIYPAVTHPISGVTQISPHPWKMDNVWLLTGSIFNLQSQGLNFQVLSCTAICFDCLHTPQKNEYCVCPKKKSMYACMHVTMNMWMCVCLSVCLPACPCVCLYACISVCLYVCMSVCLYVCMYVSMNEWMNEWMYVCMYLTI